MSVRNFVTRLTVVSSSMGRAASVLNLGLVILVLITVFFSQINWNLKIDLDQSLPLIGREISINSLTDAQWYLFAYLVMLGLAFTFDEDAHVKVDFISANLNQRTVSVVHLICNFIFLFPFIVVMVWFSWKFTQVSFLSGEGSSYGGLEDRWIVKFSLVIGFALLGLSGLANSLRLIAEILEPERT